MGKRIRYTEEFKLGAVAQVTDKGHSVTSVAGREGLSERQNVSGKIKGSVSGFLNAAIKDDYQV